MSQTETRQPQQEQEARHEQLTQEEIDRAFAQIAIILMLENMLTEEDDPLFADKQDDKKDAQDRLSGNKFKEQRKKFKKFDSQYAADIFSLLDYKLRTPKFESYMTSGSEDSDVNFETLHPRPGSDKKLTDFDADFDADRFMSDINRYRFNSFLHTTGREEAAPKSDFTPAPSMAAQELGPDLPRLAFNDRVQAQGMRPSEADFKAADRANDMYQRALFNKGWRGGEATPDQAKQAARAMQREYHPDLPSTSTADAEAIKSFNAHNAKPTTPAEAGPAPEPAASAPTESASSEK